MRNNANLHKAKAEKNNEFYTQYTDIEKELAFYKKELAGKTIYCNCDDYRSSNFVKYFRHNFNYLGLKKLIASNYDIGEGAFLFSYDGTVETIKKLNGNGDFRSAECIEFLKEADVVVTNPPFSLFREYVKQLMDYGKKFIIVGSTNAAGYKEIFSYVQNDKLWVGATNYNVGMYFLLPDSYAQYKYIDENGKKVGRVSATCWWTNIDNKRRNKKIDMFKRYSNEYPKYDNYDAIEVSKISDIPMDYDGVMGVPITFLGHYNPNQFEIVKFRKGNNNKDLAINGKETYTRILIRKRNA